MKLFKRTALLAVLVAACAAAALATGAVAQRLRDRTPPAARASSATKADRSSTSSTSSSTTRTCSGMTPNVPLRPRADAPPPGLPGRQRDGSSTNDHTVLISHTGGGTLSSLTGVYPDRHGQAVSNSFRYYKPDGTFQLGRGLVCVMDRRWIFDPTNPNPPDTLPQHGHAGRPQCSLRPPGSPSPGPDVTWGGSGRPIQVLENVRPSRGDVPKVFGTGLVRRPQEAPGRPRTRPWPTSWASTSTVPRDQRSARLRTALLSRISSPDEPGLDTWASRGPSAPST